MIEYFQERYLENDGLIKLNQILLKHEQNFSFSQIKRNNFVLKKPSICMVIDGSGQISGKIDGEFETNDLLLLNQGEYLINSEKYQILSISGENLFKNTTILKQADFPQVISTLGGTRKLLKADEGKFNIDIHLIWVDGKNMKIPHYHTRLFELYITEKGQGEILLGIPMEKQFPTSVKLEPGSFVLVPPNIVHKAQGENLVILVVGIPAFYKDDSYIVDSNDRS